MHKLNRNHEDLPEPPVKQLFDECSDKWLMADRTWIEVKDMRTMHILNCIKMMERNLNKIDVDPTTYKIYNLMQEELKSRASENE